MNAQSYVRSDHPAHSAPPQQSNWLWMGLLSLVSIAGSAVFACAATFAAVAAVAGSQMTKRDALATVFLSWALNQAVGFGWLNYPQTWDSFAWGAAIGGAALISAVVAHAVANWLNGQPRSVAVACAFLAAFAVFEVGLLAANTLLPGDWSVFAPAIVASIFVSNAAALAGLLVLERLSQWLGLIGTIGRRPQGLGPVAKA